MYANIPPPTGGLNARDPRGQMSPNDAIELVNWIPDGETVRSRAGSTTVLAQDLSLINNSNFFPSYDDIQEQALGGVIETLIEYDSGNTSEVTATAANGSPTFEKNNKLLMCSGDKVWLYGTPSTQLKTGITSAKFQSVHFKNKIILTNGKNVPLQYDGTSINNLTITSLVEPDGVTPTGENPQDLWGVNIFKGRAFYWTKNAQHYYYASAGGYQGTLTKNDLSLQVKHGGYLVSIQTYARDSGSGLDDYVAFFFSTGETLIYQGSDPASASAWSLVNSYQLAPPVDIRGFQQLGGDVIVLTIDGWQNLSASLPNQRISNANQIGEKIINLAKSEVQKNSNKFGWDIIYYPKGSLLIINIPQNENKSIQHVQNTKTGMWTTFDNWNAKCFTLLNDELYFADELGNLRKCDVGVNDDGEFITFTARPAFQSFGNESFRKQVNGVQVLTNYRYPKNIHLDINTNYNIKEGKTFDYPPEKELFDWDVSHWNEAYWSNGEDYTSNIVQSPYKMCFGIGYTISILMRMASRTQKINWFSTNVNINKVGGR